MIGLKTIAASRWSRWIRDRRPRQHRSQLGSRFFVFSFLFIFFIFTLSSTPLSFVSSRSSFLRSLFFLQLFLFFSLFSCDREIDEEEQDDTKNQPLRRKGRGGGEHVA